MDFHWKSKPFLLLQVTMSQKNNGHGDQPGQDRRGRKSQSPSGKAGSSVCNDRLSEKSSGPSVWGPSTVTAAATVEKAPVVGINAESSESITNSAQVHGTTETPSASQKRAGATGQVETGCSSRDSSDCGPRKKRKEDHTAGAEIERNSELNSRPDAVRVLPYLKIADLLEIRSYFSVKSRLDLCRELNGACTTEDVDRLCAFANQYGWIGIVHHSEGAYTAFSSPKGDTIVIWTGEEEPPLPQELLQVLSDPFIAKVCLDPKATVAYCARCGLTETPLLLEVNSIMIKYQFGWKQILASPCPIPTEIKAELFQSDPGRYKQQALNCAYHTAQTLACSIWDAAWRAMPNSLRARDSGNLCHWTREIIAMFAAKEGSVEQRNSLIDTCSFLRRDPYTAQRLGWVCSRMPEGPEQEVANWIKTLRCEYAHEIGHSNFIYTRCRKCGQPEHETAMEHCPFRRAACGYPLCSTDEHTLLTCPVLSGRCRACLQRGHTAANHGEYSPLHLENMFLIYSEFHLAAGYITYLKPTYEKHCYQSLYGDTQLSMKLEHAYSISTILPNPRTNLSISDVRAQIQDMSSSALGNTIALCDSETAEKRSELRDIEDKKVFLQNALLDRARFQTKIVASIRGPAPAIGPTKQWLTEVREFARTRAPQFTAEELKDAKAASAESDKTNPGPKSNRDPK